MVELKESVDDVRGDGPGGGGGGGCPSCSSELSESESGVSDDELLYGTRAGGASLSELAVEVEDNDVNGSENGRKSSSDSSFMESMCC